MSYLELNINPFLRDELYTSYEYNLGVKYPALYIKENYKPLSIYDGILKIGDEEIYLQDYKLGELAEEMNALGVDTYIYEDIENISAIMLLNFSNEDIVYTEIDRSPIDVGLIKSQFLVNNIVNKYSEDVIIEVLNTDDVTYRNNKIFSHKNKIGKDIATKHFASTFILNISDKNMIRSFDNIDNIPGAISGLTISNIDIKGKDNADYNI